MARKKFPMAVVDLDKLKEPVKKQKFLKACPNCGWLDHISGVQGTKYPHNCVNCHHLNVITL